jgi:hypothetical protein
VKLSPELVATIISTKSNGFIAKGKDLKLEGEGGSFESCASQDLLLV